MLFLFCAPAFGQGGSSITPSGAAPPVARGPTAPEATLPPLDAAAIVKCNPLPAEQRARCLRAARGADLPADAEPKARGSADREGPGSTGMGSGAGSSR